MSEVMKLQKKVQELTALLGSRDDLAEELRVKDSLLRKLQEHVQHLKEACEAGSRELQRCKAENYDLALRLARQALRAGGAACTVLNGANEEAVAAFLREEIPFGGILDRIEEALSRLAGLPANSLEDIFEADRRARQIVRAMAPA